jgi:hypothetical protein
MKTLLNLLLLLQGLFLLSSNTYCQFEFKPGISASSMLSPMDIAETGTHLEIAYVPVKHFSIGVYGSYGNLFSHRDTHYVLSTGVVFEWRFKISDKMKIIPLINFPIGYSSEYEKHYYTYGDNNQYETNIDRRTEGISAAFRTGFVTNLDKTGSFQFQFDIGFLQQSIRFEIFNESEISFLQSRLLLVYSL